MEKLPTTQEHLDVVDIVDRFVILRNGACSVVQPSPVNFDLLSEREQDTVINTFAGFLNSLTFPLQTVVHTRRTDITDYLKRLENAYEKQANPFLQERIKSYKEYIDRLASRKDILDKRFYVVIPYFDTTLIKSHAGFMKKTETTFSKETLPRVRDHLEPKINHVVGQLTRLGVKVKVLEEKQLVELFYTIYNPTTSRLEHITAAASEYTTPFVEAIK